jgi:hypothetical protein
MKICFLVDLPKGLWQWDDGLREALRLLESKYDICYHLDGNLGSHIPDIVFAWGGTLAKTYKEGLAYKGKKALFFAGGPRNPELFTGYDIVFFENDLHTYEVRGKGINCLTAFGTNTRIFKPMHQPKLFDCVYPGAFGLWKRKDLYARATREFRSFTFGNIQEHEPECWQVCVDNGIAVSADLPQDRVPYIMNMSRTVVLLPVPDIGGQRTILEAMACKIPVIIPNDAPLLVEYAAHGGMVVEPTEEAIAFAIRWPVDMTEMAYQYIMENRTERHYAATIEEGLKRI